MDPNQIQYRQDMTPYISGQSNLINPVDPNIEKLQFLGQLAMQVPQYTDLFLNEYMNYRYPQPKSGMDAWMEQMMSGAQAAPGNAYGTPQQPGAMDNFTQNILTPEQEQQIMEGGIDMISEIPETSATANVPNSYASGGGSTMFKNADQRYSNLSNQYNSFNPYA